MEIFYAIVAAIWFFLPCGIANSVPVIAMHLPVLKDMNYPLDFGKSLGGIRIFGDHKTFRGLISGMIFGVIVVAIQVSLYNAYEPIRNISWVKYNEINWVVFALLSGAGPLLGDAIKSFFKRRMNLKPGATWFPFDQIDYILGGIIFVLPIVQLEWWKYILVAVIYFIAHPMATFLGYLLKMKDSPI
jgi:CDP-2,3-bis-(O-geranylgeranyl)-sn-glycerol synthase